MKRRSGGDKELGVASGRKKKLMTSSGYYSLQVGRVGGDLGRGENVVGEN